MLPLTLSAVQKCSDLLTFSSALALEIENVGASNGVRLPTIDAGQIVLSSASNDIGDADTRLGFPRVCLYSAGLRNSQSEKFCSISGAVNVTADIWTSGNFVTDTDRWIHYYVEAVTVLLRKSVGDWGDGFFFSGLYDVQFQPPKMGGVGFVQFARLKFDLMITQE